MNLRHLCSALGLASLAGCTAVPLPPEAASVTLRSVWSAAIEIYRPRLRIEKGKLELESYVFRRSEAQTTENSHVDLVFLDAASRVLRVETADFSPRWLSRTPRPPQPHGYFRKRIPEIPSGTVAIEVRGHDGPHEARPGFSAR